MTIDEGMEKSLQEEACIYSGMKRLIFLSLLLVGWFAVALPASAQENVLLSGEFWETAMPQDVTEAIDAGAAIEARDGTGESPLHWAATFGETPEVIELLLDRGANAAVRSREGKTAFDYAKKNEHLQNSKAYWRLHDARFQ